QEQIVEVLFYQERRVECWLTSCRRERKQNRRHDVVFVDLESRTNSVNAVRAVRIRSAEEVLVDELIVPAARKTKRRLCARGDGELRGCDTQIFAVLERTRDAD